MVFGALGTGLLLIAYDPSLFARWKWIFVGLGVAVITGVTLLSLGVRYSTLTMMRRLAGTTSLVLGALLGLKALYRISPPLVLVAVVEVLFLFAWVRLGSERTVGRHPKSSDG